MSGIAVAVTSKGQRPDKSQFCFNITAKIKTTGKLTEAIIDANETYRHVKTTISHIEIAIKAQIV